MVQNRPCSLWRQEGKKVGDIPNPSRRAGRSPAPQPALPENATSGVSVSSHFPWRFHDAFM